MSQTKLNTDLSLTHDPYEKLLQQQKYAKNLIFMDNSSKFTKKLNKLKNKMGEAKNNMIQGAIMGFMVGGLFGFAIGCYSAFQTRRFLAIPISTFVSGASFSFILGCGSMIRADEIINQIEPLQQGDWMQIKKFNQRIL